MADNDALRAWLEGVAQRHGMTAAGGVATAAAGGDDLEVDYEKLGGDAALLKILGDEDELFRTELAKQRAVAQDWQKDRRRELESQKTDLEGGLEEAAKAPRWQAWLDRERAALDSVMSSVNELGDDKLRTEPGKELLQAIAEIREHVELVERSKAEEQLWSEHARPALELVRQRFEDVERTYEAIERRIRDSRTEVDNALEIRAMSMEEKVARLRAGAGKGRAEALKKVEAELAKVIADSQAEDRANHAFYSYPTPEGIASPKDWKPIEKKLAELQSTPAEKLAAADPALAKLENDYEAAGGDEALFEKLHAAWREDSAGTSNVRNNLMLIDREQEKELRQRVVDAGVRLQATRKEVAELRSKQESSQARLERMTQGASSGDLLSPRESAELELLSRELKRLEKDIPNREQLVPVLEASKINAEKLLENARQRHELRADDDGGWQVPPEPRSRDIHAMPLRVKYEKLTEK